MKKILFLFILSFSIITLIIHNNYYISQNISISAQIAKPIFHVCFNPPITLNNSNTSVQYSFKVNNYKENVVSDIPFNYYFIIENITNEFEVKGYINSKEIIFNNFKTETFFLNNSIQEEHIFTININYIGNFINPILSNFVLKIYYEQI